MEKAEQKLEVHEDSLWKYCEEKGIDNIEGFEGQANDPYIVKQKKRRCQNAQKLLKYYEDQLHIDTIPTRNGRELGEIWVSKVGTNF